MSSSPRIGKQLHGNVPHMPCGFGWNGTLQNVFKWAVFGVLCGWGAFLGVAFVGITQHVLTAYTRGELSAKDAAIAFFGALCPTIAHTFMVKHAVLVWKNYGRKVDIQQMLVSVPTAEQHVPVMPYTEQHDRPDGKIIAPNPKEQCRQNSSSLVLSNP